jgi:hypothetical protein
MVTTPGSQVTSTTRAINRIPAPIKPPETVPPRLSRATRSGSKRRVAPKLVNASEKTPEIVGMLDLRRYEERDGPSVWRLHDEGLRQTGVHAGDGPGDDDLRSVAATYLTDDGEFLVGLIAGAVVAMGALRRVSSTVAEVKRMRSTPAFGVADSGRAVLQGLEARAPTSRSGRHTNGLQVLCSRGAAYMCCAPFATSAIGVAR